MNDDADFDAYGDADDDEGLRDPTPPSIFAELERLLGLSRRDLRQAARTLGLDEARYLVDAYYIWQSYRIAAAGQVRSLTTGQPAEPAEALRWVLAQLIRTEDDIRVILDAWTEHEPSGMARWAKQHVGIGPVIAAGLRAHLDVSQARTVGHWWRFAGLDPSNEWLGRGRAEEMVQGAYATLQLAASAPPTTAVLVMMAMKTSRPLATIERLATDKAGKQTRKALEAGLARRPWNASLKVLLWKMGESFVKQQNHKDCFWGQLFVYRKLQEQTNNEAGKYADQADAKLARFNISKETDAYLWYAGCLTPEQGQQLIATPAEQRLGMTRKLAGAPGSGVKMLPPAHIHARAKRYAVKMFLSQYHEEAYRRQYGVLPPVPYAIAHLGHTDRMRVPVPFTPVPGEDDRTAIPKGEERPGKRG